MWCTEEYPAARYIELAALRERKNQEEGNLTIHYLHFQRNIYLNPFYFTAVETKICFRCLSTQAITLNIEAVITSWLHLTFYNTVSSHKKSNSLSYASCLLSACVGQLCTSASKRYKWCLYDFLVVTVTWLKIFERKPRSHMYLGVWRSLGSPLLSVSAVNMFNTTSPSTRYSTQNPPLLIKLGYLRLPFMTH